MSFILEALKKSETERQQQGSAEFSSVPTSSEKPNPARWLWLLAVLLGHHELHRQFNLPAMMLSDPQAAIGGHPFASLLTEPPRRVRVEVNSPSVSAASGQRSSSAGYETAIQGQLTSEKKLSAVSCQLSVSAISCLPC